MGRTIYISLLWYAIIGMMTAGMTAEQVGLSVLAEGSVTGNACFPTLDECIELYYDDDSMEGAGVWPNGDSGFAVEFTVEGGYPARIDSARIQVCEGWPDGDHDPYGIELWADTETLVYRHENALNATGDTWYAFDLGSTVVEGDFLIAYIQYLDYPDCEGLNCDSSSPPSGRNFSIYDERNFVREYTYGNWAIRALVNCPAPPDYSVSVRQYQEIVVEGGTCGMHIRMQNNTSSPATGWLYATGYGRKIGIMHGTIPSRTTVHYNWNLDTEYYQLQPGTYHGYVAIGPNIGSPVDRTGVEFTIIKEGLE